jgi:hypothetical protein
MAKTEKQMFPREFVIWKDQFTEHCTNSFSPHYQQYRADTHGIYPEGFKWLWFDLDGLYEFWRLEIEPKNKEDEK